MTETHTHSHDVQSPTSDPKASPASSGHQVDSRMMWVMMIGCCLAIPLALIIGGAGLGSLAGANNWLIGAVVVLAIALVITRRISSGRNCDSPDGP